MKITIENGDLIYIYLRKFNGKKVTCIPSVCFDLLYGENNNWLGMIIYYYDGQGKKIKFPEIKSIDYPLYKGKVKKTDDYIELIFNDEIEIKEIKECTADCNIDYNNEGLFGVELILYRENIGGQDVAKPFITNDIQSIML